MPFSAEVLSAGQGGHAVAVPKEVAQAFSSKRPPVLAHVNGVEYRSGSWCMAVKAISASAGSAPAADVTVGELSRLNSLRP